MFQEKGRGKGHFSWEVTQGNIQRVAFGHIQDFISKNPGHLKRVVAL